MSVCRMQGCSLDTTGYSIFCDAHKRRNRRHGHPEQQGVTVQEIEPFRRRVRTRIEKNIDNPAWQILRDRWEHLVLFAATEEERYTSGTPHNRHEREAWSSVTKIGAAAKANDVIEVVLAMYLLQDDNPHRFRSDEAFGGQLVRRVRSLAPTSIGSYYDHQTTKIKKVYRDTKPRTSAILARTFQETFGVAGLTVARLEHLEIDQKRSEQQALHNALGELE